MRFEEMSLRKASLKYPILLAICPREMFFDDDYIVRVSTDGNLRFEIGYASDPEWVLK